MGWPFGCFSLAVVREAELGVERLIGVVGDRKQKLWSFCVATVEQLWASEPGVKFLEEILGCMY